MKPSSGGMTAEQEQLAEVPQVTPNKRLVGELRDLANLVENSALSVIADDDVIPEARRLWEALGVKVEAAERQREVFGG